MSLILNHISYTYNPGTAFETKALNDVSLTVKDGEILSIIGKTGSGKSTLLQHMNGLLSPDEGDILYNGADILQKDFDKRSLRFKVGIVFQYPEHQLFDETVIKDVAFGPRNMGYDDTKARILAMEALEKTGVEEEVYEESCFNLSGGQKRRAAIAGVLAMNPDILVLDEPAAGLDPAGKRQILDLIKELRESGRTIVMVSHSMEDVAEISDRIAVMDKGRIIMEGAPSEIFGRIEELEGIGLSAPEVIYISRRLKEAGIPVNTAAVTVEEVAADILNLYR